MMVNCNHIGMALLSHTASDHMCWGGVSIDKLTYLSILSIPIILETGESSAQCLEIVFAGRQND